MKPNHIRPIAICLFRHGSRILVSDGLDSETGRYCRPLGGAIEFGERAQAAIVRETDRSGSRLYVAALRSAAAGFGVALPTRRVSWPA